MKIPGIESARLDDLGNVPWVRVHADSRVTGPGESVSGARAEGGCVPSWFEDPVRAGAPVAPGGCA